MSEQTPTEQTNPEANLDFEQKQALSMLSEIPLTITVELGETYLPIKDLLTLSSGSVVELDRLVGESINLSVNGVLVGKGDVVVVNENYGMRITELISAEERLKTL